MTLILNKDSLSGMTDRLYMIVGAYYFAKRHHREFRIYYDGGFDWQRYFEPVETDWRCSKNELSFYLPHDVPVKLPGSLMTLPSFPIDYHVYWTYDLGSLRYIVPVDEWRKLFHELFRLSDYTYGLLGQLPLRAGEYIAVHTRFLNCLEQKEETIWGVPLSEQKQEQLIADVLRVVNNIRSVHGPDVALVVAGDSDKFNRILQAAIPNAIVSSSQVGHISHEHSSEIHDAAIKDFLTLSRAKKVYGIVLDNMYESGYARYASIVGGVDYCVVRSVDDVLV